VALLAEVDRRLGVWIEAKEEFRAALAKSGDDGAIRTAADQIEKFPFAK